MAEKKYMQNNLAFYEKLRTVPEEAIKQIGAGRLKGMSDINPMYRIKVMTETFGPCGIGWKYEITKQWHEQFGQEIKAFCNINLYIKVDGEWSEPIPGTGGSSFVAVESKGIYVSDECEKMALTDALSVAMKALGVAADVYYSKDKSRFDTKYEQQEYSEQQAQVKPKTTAAPQQTTMFDDSLQEAFELIKANIENAPSRQYLTDLHAQNPELHNFPKYRELMNKRFKELAA